MGYGALTYRQNRDQDCSPLGDLLALQAHLTLTLPFTQWLMIFL